MKCWKVAVTFEKGNGQPKTVRLAIPAGSLRTAASRAIRAARHYYPHTVYDSVVLLIERDDLLLAGVESAETFDRAKEAPLHLVPASFFRPKQPTA